MTTATFVQRTTPDGEFVCSVEFPEDSQGFGIARYVITRKPGLRIGQPDRFLVFIVLVADGLCLNDNLPVACCASQGEAFDRANAA